MGSVKGTALDSLRKVVKGRGAEFEQKYLDQLTPEQRDIFTSTSTVSKREMNSDDESILKSAAKMLYPAVINPLRKLGYETALISIPSFYKIFIRVSSPVFVLKRSAAIWRQFHGEGEASVEDLKEKSCTFIVKDYPTLPAYFREVLTGSYEGICSLAGAKNSKVFHMASDPNTWKWKFTWE